MNNFSYKNPVKIIFGKDTIANLTKEIPSADKILILYGGGSIKKNGVYETISKALEKHEWYEFSGIEPNPTYETCLKAITLIKEKNINYLLAVGGGSVIDATKFIAASVCLEDNTDPWDILSKGTAIKKALPFGVVLTLPATGSEMNNGGVISKIATHEKFSFSSEYTYPTFSILDPETTYSLPVKQISNGVVDSFVHVIEQYLTYPVDAMLQDKFAESILETLTLEGPRALETPQDYNIRANLMWASSWALNGWIGCGVPQDWATHMIGHEITALTGIDHAQTLAIVLPGVMQVMKEQKSDKIIQLGEQVFGIYNNMSREERIENTIKAVEVFFNEMQIKTRFSDYNVDKSIITTIVDRFKQRKWKLGEKQNITYDIVQKILESRL